MKVLILNGSPKGNKSNTFKLASAFVEGISSAADIDVEKVYVCDSDIRDCKGCFGCWRNSSGKCVYDDDMTFIIPKMIEADIIIWSFPLYYFGLPSRLKALIDRMLPTVLPFMASEAESGGHESRYDLSAQRHVLISTCGFYTARGNYDAVISQFDKMYGKDGYDTVFCGQGELFSVPELKARTDPYLGVVKQAGAEFVCGTISDETRRELDKPLFEREVFEEMADAHWGISKNENKVEYADPAVSFTKQMAAMYNKKSWTKDRVLEFHYTDVEKTCQIVMKRDGHEVLSRDFLPYTTRIETPLSVWQSIGKGELSGEQAMMRRLYTVDGEFDIMLDWDRFFGIGKTNVMTASNKHVKKTNMTVMLLPWILIWIALSIDGFWGGIAGLSLCMLLPFAFLKFKVTAFECLTMAAVSAVSLMSLLGLPIQILLPSSYLAFGLMWSITVFMRIPLSAYYSMNGYGGERAFDNPLFIRTNRILSMCWGILYLVTPVWTYFIMLTPISYLTAVFNSALPIVLGIFTAWFQKWYPVHYAKGRK